MQGCRITLFITSGWERGDVPEDVTHIRIDSSVRAIGRWAFCDRRQLRIVILNKELEEIGREAFEYCTSMEETVIPNAVRDIEDYAFGNCMRLTRVTLGNGLEEIGWRAFYECTSLEEIVIPNAVRVIRDWAFYECTRLTRVTLGDGLEEIGERAFEDCESLEEIVIPPAVRDIHNMAFIGCTNLTRVKFCDKIEEFVSCDAMSDSWNRGVGKLSLRTYCFLVRCDISARFKGLALVSSWQATIHNMPRIIPTIAAPNNRLDEDDEEGMNAHFDAKLTINEHLLNEAHVLFPEQGLSWIFCPLCNFC